MPLAHIIPVVTWAFAVFCRIPSHQWVTSQNQQKIKISAISVNSQRPPLFGSDRDRIFIADNFDEPLDDFQEYM